MLRRHLLVLLPALLLPWLAPARPAHAETTWQWPLGPSHQVVRGFAPPLHDWLPGHRGVDLAARAGQPVLAAGAGRVAFSGRIGGVWVVSVRHPGGLETTYEPVRPAVRAGAPVNAGAVLGWVATRGSHCLPVACLHWGARRGATYLDPLSLVAVTQVRLLPMLSATSGHGWLVPAAGGASVGSSAVVVGWAVASTRRRRRRLPPGVTSLTVARADRRRRSARVDERTPAG